MPIYHSPYVAGIERLCVKSAWTWISTDFLAPRLSQIAFSYRELWHFLRP
jgi:hypothetical protein